MAVSDYKWEGILEVNGKDSREKFKRADQWFRDGKYDDALRLLTELDLEHPDTRNILVPMALCLERLGRHDEALPLCERLVRKHADSRAREILERLRLPRALPELHVDALVDDHDFADAYTLPDLGPVTTIPVPVHSEDEPSHWPVRLLIGFGLLAVVGVILLPLFSGEPANGGGSETTGLSGERTGLLLGFALLGFVYALATGTLNASLALGAVGKLPSNSFGGLILDVGGTILVVNLIFAVLHLLTLNIRSVPVSVLILLLEFGVLGFAFQRNYRLGAGNLVAFMLIYTILTCVLVVLPVLLLLGAAGLLVLFAI